MPFYKFIQKIVIGDNTPPVMDKVCEMDITKDADKLQVNTIVTWPEVNAWDEVDGSVL